MNRTELRSAALASPGHSTEAPIVIRAEGLATGYGNRVVLEDVDFVVRAGEFWFVLGPNGAGKSTLLRTFLGALAPIRGRLVVSDDIASRDGLGFVPQRCDLNPTLPTTVREFVDLGLVGLRVTTAAANERREWALARAGLDGMTQRNYWSLSGGQRQRALVARALIRRPRVIVVDEPTNGLDVAAEDAILSALSLLHREDGLTVLFVTHELEIAARYATHVAIVRDGGVVAGLKAQVLTAENLARAYDSTPDFFRDLWHQAPRAGGEGGA